MHNGETLYGFHNLLVIGDDTWPSKTWEVLIYCWSQQHTSGWSASHECFWAL